MTKGMSTKQKTGSFISLNSKYVVANSTFQNLKIKKNIELCYLLLSSLLFRQTKIKLLLPPLLLTLVFLGFLRVGDPSSALSGITPAILKCSSIFIESKIGVESFFLDQLYPPILQDNRRCIFSSFFDAFDGLS